MFTNYSMVKILRSDKNVFKLSLRCSIARKHFKEVQYPNVALQFSVCGYVTFNRVQFGRTELGIVKTASWCRVRIFATSE